MIPLQDKGRVLAITRTIGIAKELGMVNISGRGDAGEVDLARSVVPIQR